MVVKKIVTEAVYEDLFAELVATVRVPAPMAVGPGVTLSCPTKKQVNDLQTAVDEDAAQRVIFGDQYDAAIALFDNQPLGIWNAFMEKWNEHFFGDSDQGK